MSGSRENVNSVFYAKSYHPIQAGSIDGTNILPHDSAVYRAHLCSQAGLYDALGDPKVIGDPYCTVFVGRFSHLTTEESLLKAMNRKVKNLRLVRHIVTGASRGYAFFEYETEREMRGGREGPFRATLYASGLFIVYLVLLHEEERAILTIVELLLLFLFSFLNIILEDKNVLRVVDCHESRVFMQLSISRG